MNKTRFLEVDPNDSSQEVKFVLDFGPYHKDGKKNEPSDDDHNSKTKITKEKQSNISKEDIQEIRKVIQDIQNTSRKRKREIPNKTPKNKRKRLNLEFNDKLLNELWLNQLPNEKSMQKNPKVQLELLTAKFHVSLDISSKHKGNTFNISIKVNNVKIISENAGKKLKRAEQRICHAALEIFADLKEFVSSPNSFPLIKLGDRFSSQSMGEELFCVEENLNQLISSVNHLYRNDFLGTIHLGVSKEYFVRGIKISWLPQLFQKLDKIIPPASVSSWKIIPIYSQLELNKGYHYKDMISICKHQGPSKSRNFNPRISLHSTWCIILITFDKKY